MRSLEYLAGFFDGEGCVTCYDLKANPNWVKIRVTVSVKGGLRLSNDESDRIADNVVQMSSLKRTGEFS